MSQPSESVARKRGRPEGTPSSSSGSSANLKRKRRAGSVSESPHVISISKSIQSTLLPDLPIKPINHSVASSPRSNQSNPLRSSVRLSQSKSNLPITTSQEARQGTKNSEAGKSNANPYKSLICVVCLIPACVHHNTPRVNFERNKQAGGSQKWTKRWILQPKDVENSKAAPERSTYVPCDHEGACDPDNKDCTCSEEHVHCEKYCACPQNCPRRWRGCQCRNGKICGGDKCACTINNRECDPDLCMRCGADEQLDPVNRLGQDEDGSLYSGSLSRTEVRELACQNVFIQLNEPPMIMVGPTTMPFKGDGLFALEPLKKGDYIGEYVGEVITDELADKRGKQYDKDGLSYLFGVNKSHTLDGTQFGNKFRYINHSGLEPNCRPRVLLVNGVHRISFSALEDIPAGTELLFDYGDSFKLESLERPGAMERRISKEDSMGKNEMQQQDCQNSAQGSREASAKQTINIPTIDARGSIKPKQIAKKTTPGTGLKTDQGKII